MALLYFQVSLQCLQVNGLQPPLHLLRHAKSCCITGMRCSHRVRCVCAASIHSYARSYISPYRLAVLPATKSEVMVPRAWKYVPSMAGSALSQ